MARKKRRVTKPNRRFRRAVNQLTRQAKAENPNASPEELAEIVAEDLEDMGLSAGVNIGTILMLIQAFMKIAELWKER